MSISTFFRSFFNLSGSARDPNVPAKPVLSAARPAPKPVSQPFDPIHPPFTDAFEPVKELYGNRSRNMELGVAIAAKVDAWRLLYRMGSPQAIHHDFRNHIISAEAKTDRFEQVLIYSIMQNVLFNNFSNAHEVRNL